MISLRFLVSFANKVLKGDAPHVGNGVEASAFYAEVRSLIPASPHGDESCDGSSLCFSSRSPASSTGMGSSFLICLCFFEEKQGVPVT